MSDHQNNQHQTRKSSQQISNNHFESSQQNIQIKQLKDSSNNLNQSNQIKQSLQVQNAFSYYNQNKQEQQIRKKSSEKSNDGMKSCDQQQNQNENNKQVHEKNQKQVQQIQQNQTSNIKNKAEEQISENKSQQFKQQNPSALNKQQQDDPQLQQDLKALKKSYADRDKKKKTFTQQSQQHHRLNKTSSHIKSDLKKIKNKQDEQQSSLQSQSIDQKRMIIKMAISKKNQNYKKLISWDKKRATQLALHQSIVLNLENQVNKRIKSSLENFQVYLTFFKEKAKQQEKYCNYPITDIKKALTNNNISKSVFINCSIILNSLSDENQQKCKKIADFVTIIKKNIIKQTMQEHFNQSQKQLMKVRQKISNLKATLQKQISQTQQKTKDLMQKVVVDQMNIKNIKVYQNQKSHNVHLAGDCDFYKLQLIFLSSAKNQLNTQKKLGQACIQYYDTAVKQQYQRSATIRQSMLTFSKALKATYQIDLQQQQIEQLSKGQQNKLIQEMYSIDQFFDQRNLKIFRQHLRIPNNQCINANHINKYINQFSYQDFDSRMLLLKEYSLFYHSGNKDQKCDIVITVDYFLHFFLQKEKQKQTTHHYHMKPDVSLKINQKIIDVKDTGDCKIEIHKKSQRKGSMMSYFWQQKPQAVYKLQFLKQDSKEQFLDYIRKLLR